MFSKSNLFLSKFNRSEKIILIFTAILTTLASEVKVVPFEEEAFRFGLGSVAFFLLILIWTPVSYLRTGLVTGITVVCFRVLEESMLDGVQVVISLKNNFPAFFFYFVFAMVLDLIKIEKYKSSPLILGAWATLLEVIGNVSEHVLRHGLLHQDLLSFKDFALICGVALFRSYFVVGLYSSITVSEQKKQMQEMLGVGSELYAETLYLQKSLNHIEQITASSHDLYRRLKKKELHDLSIQALHIAQEIHEVKKDSQRILSGLTKITKQQKETPLFLSDVMGFVISANEKYSELLKKKISFQLSMSVDFETDKQIPLLAVLNNLTANAVEAIVGSGDITVTLFEESEFTCFVMKDTGKGILKEDESIIFEPGYTTKYNEQGVAATGIGLSHVREIIQQLNGTIQIESPPIGTIFRIHIPTENIRKRVE
ncbi:sensor histidine kinase [Bacillus sp. FJAT-22090]|uniref:sensor histidine kinase n=1 Tax=Bacillus sp. FJAT-22090 TaxID=1581038 RepID=UPI0006AFDDAC|nr:sensor histidine kinase [Bacillus sp. FJAT-22090]